jgi:hypothetical protein
MQRRQLLQHRRREILWLGVTAHPNAEWISCQITEAFGWEQAPRYIVRDRDGVYGEVFNWRVRTIIIFGPYQHGMIRAAPTPACADRS